MNRGSVGAAREAVAIAERASMRPRFMNRGSVSINVIQPESNPLQ